MNESTQTNLISKAKVLYISDNNDENTANILKTNTQELLTLSTNTFEEYDSLKNRIDLVVADISSKNDLTFTLVKKIRASNDWQKPILLISDLKDNSILSEIIKFKMENFILKPFQEGTFLKIIDDIVSKIEKTKVIENQREKLEQFQLILDKLNLVSETNLKGEITYVNQRFCDVSGFTKEELIGHTHKILRHNDTSSEIYQKMWENLQSGKMWLGKLKNNNKNNEPYYIKLIIVPIKDTQGKIYKYMSSAFLISDIEEEKQKLKKFILNQKLDQLNSKKTTQEEINNKARDLVLKAKQDALDKEEKLIRYVRELDEELKRLRIIRERDKKQIAFLEKEYKEYMENTDTEKKIFQERLEKVLIAGRKSYEKSTFLKKKCDALTIKIKRSQDGIVTLQGYVEEYRNTIDNLQDVIKAHEKTIEELKKGAVAPSSSLF
jgi:PAS domain S-box-containing protein